jgi:hypothetical protein
MQHRLNQLEKLILAGAVSDLKTLKAGKPIAGSNRTAGYYRLSQAVADAREQSLVRLDISRWLRHTPETAAERMAISRAYGSLEKKGFVERSAVSMAAERTTHLVVTAAGRKLAAELPAASAIRL